MSDPKNPSRPIANTADQNDIDANDAGILTGISDDAVNFRDRHNLTIPQSKAAAAQASKPTGKRTV